LESLESQLVELAPSAAGPAAPAAPAEPRGLPIGSPAPDFTLPDLAGEPHALADLRDRQALLIFFNPGCGFCQQMVPDLVALPADGPGGKPVPLLVTTGGAERNRDLLQAIRFPVLLQEQAEVAALYAAHGTPM